MQEKVALLEGIQGQLLRCISKQLKNLRETLPLATCMKETPAKYFAFTVFLFPKMHLWEVIVTERSPQPANDTKKM